MSIWVVDAICSLLIVLGIALAIRRPARPRSDRSQTVHQPDGDPKTYILRIAGVMLAAFGLALGVMVTAFHFA